MSEHSVSGGFDGTGGPECVVHGDGTEEWLLNGQRHREDGPALVRPDGSRMWYLYGLRHREDGPAAVCSDGGRLWFLNGRCHRDDGPAVEWPNGDREWRILDHRVDEATADAYANLPPSGKAAVRTLLFAGAHVTEAVSAAVELAAV